MTARILIIGAINVDLTVSCDRLPSPGETVVGPGIERHGGGKGANAAVAAARAGGSVRYCGAVGSDDVGLDAIAELRGEGIDVADVAVLEGVTTGMALIVVDPRGENQIAVGAGANAALTPAMVRAAIARAAGWAQCLLISTEIPPEAAVAAVEAATAHQMLCVINPAPVLPELRDVLSAGSIFTPNLSELTYLHSLLGGPAEAALAHMARSVAQRSLAPVVVTRGAEGVLIAQPDGTTTEIPAPVISDVKDTTGAGDTFNGVFVTALAQGDPLLAACVRGVTAASLSVGSIGARAGMPLATAIDAELVLGASEGRGAAG